MARNVECIGHPHSTRLGCGWKGERFPNVPMYWQRPTITGPVTEFTREYVDAIAAKRCPKCEGIVFPIVPEGVEWPA